MKASTLVSLNPSPAKPHVDRKKSDREANSTSSNDKGLINDAANGAVRVLLASPPPKRFEERCLESVVDGLDAVFRSGITEGFFHVDAVVDDSLLFSQKFLQTGLLVVVCSVQRFEMTSLLCVPSAASFVIVVANAFPFSLWGPRDCVGESCIRRRRTCFPVRFRVVNVGSRRRWV